MRNNIRQYRKAMRLTQKELCDILGWKLRRLQTYEQGSRMPSILDALELSEALGVYVDNLFER